MGRAFGDVGDDEQIGGTATGELDPFDPRNALITDINLAPRNANGKVAYTASFTRHKPVDMNGSSGAMVYEGVKQRQQAPAALHAGRNDCREYRRRRLPDQELVTTTGGVAGRATSPSIPRPRSTPSRSPAAAGVTALTFARFIGAWGSTRPLPAASLWVFYLLQRVALVYAYPFAALAFVLVPFGAAAFFGKRLSSGVLIGTALIVAGICVTGLSRSCIDVRFAPDIDLEKVYVVVAAYREADVIAETVGVLVERFPNVVVVDDGSPDATSERARQAGAVVLRHPFNLGQGAALQTGLACSGGKGRRRRSAVFDARRAARGRRPGTDAGIPRPTRRCARKPFFWGRLKRCPGAG